MNNKYAYRENDVLVNTDKGIEPREYVDNFDDILRVENNIDILENRIKCSEHTLNNLMSLRKDGKIIFSILASFGILLSLAVFGATVLLGIGIGADFILPALKFAGTAIGVCSGVASLCYLPVVAQGTTKKNIENLKNKISVYKYELEQEEKTVNELKQKSKKIEVPKSDKIITVLTSYQIENLKHKLVITKVFKENLEMFVGAYNNGTLANILEECCDSKNVMEDIMLVRYLISEYREQKIEKENVKGKTKSKNKR